MCLWFKLEILLTRRWPSVEAHCGLMFDTDGWVSYTAQQESPCMFASVCALAQI